MNRFFLLGLIFTLIRCAPKPDAGPNYRPQDINEFEGIINGAPVSTTHSIWKSTVAVQVFF
jgi:hypothetical protein